MIDRFFIDQQFAGGMHLHVDLKHNICLLQDPSGRGKTYGMQLIQIYCAAEGKECFCINSLNFNGDISTKIKGVRSGGIVLLDDAELYLTNDLLSDIYREDLIILVSTHADIEYQPNISIGYYYVRFDCNSVSIVEE